MALLRQAGLRRGHNDLDDDQSGRSICGCPVLEVSPWRRWLLKSRRAKPPLTAGNQHSQEAVLRRSTSFSPGDHSLYFHALWVYFRAICVYFAAFWVYFAAVYRRPHERCFWDERRLEIGLNDTRTMT